VALAEERVTGKKYAPGYSESLKALLRHQELSLGHFDRIGVSTCCERQELALQAHELADHPRVESVNHHLSHASLAFYSSGFERAIVAVVDGGGNVLASGDDEVQADDWWAEPREQHSYYLATRRHGLELVCRYSNSR